MSYLKKKVGRYKINSTIPGAIATFFFYSRPPTMQCLSSSPSLQNWAIENSLTSSWQISRIFCTKPKMHVSSHVGKLFQFFPSKPVICRRLNCPFRQRVTRKRTLIQSPKSRNLSTRNIASGKTRMAVCQVMCNKKDCYIWLYKWWGKLA